MPRVGPHRPADDPQVIVLRAGQTYNVRAHGTVPTDLFLGLFYSERELLDTFRIPKEALMSEKGADIYPVRDAVLVARWESDTKTGSLVAFTVAHLSTSKEERLIGRSEEITAVRDP